MSIESVASLASDITEIDTTELNEYLKLLMQINNMLVMVIDNLQKVNTQLVTTVSNVSNFRYILNTKVEKEREVFKKLIHSENTCFRSKRTAE